MKATIITLLFAASIAGASGREHNLLVDLARPRTLRLTCASATDSTITADVKKNGSDFDASGWTGLFWLGDDGGGVTLTNVTYRYGQMTWDFTSENVPTNGRYNIMILGAKDGRTEEWGSGLATISANPSKDSLPAQWGEESETYHIATNALRIAQAAYSEAGMAVGIANANSATGALHTAQIDALNAETGRIGVAIGDLRGLAATNRTDKLWSAEKTYMDGDGVMWEIQQPMSYVISDAAYVPAIGAYFDFSENDPVAKTITYTNADYGYIVHDYGATPMTMTYGGYSPIYLRPEDPVDVLDFEVKGIWQVTLVRVSRLPPCHIAVGAVATTNNSIIITSQTTDSTGTVTQQTVRAGETILTNRFFGKNESLEIGANYYPRSGGSLNDGATLSIKKTGPFGTEYTELGTGYLRFYGTGGINNKYVLPYNSTPGSQYLGFLATRDDITEAIAEIPPVEFPQNATTGWLIFDKGSNLWVNVDVTNLNFEVWEVTND